MRGSYVSYLVQRLTLMPRCVCGSGGGEGRVRLLVVWRCRWRAGAGVLVRIWR